MSIFTKDCPQCAETNAAYAVRCKCGFAFSADDGDANSRTEEQIALEEEKLYQEYLTVRAQQASSTADDTTKLAATQPANHAKLKDPEQAKAAAERAQAELKVQTTRVVDSTTVKKHAKVEPPAAPAVAQTPNVEPAPSIPKAPAPTPTTQTTIPTATTQAQAPKPSAEAKPSWLISGNGSDAQPEVPTQPPAIKPTTPVKSTPNAKVTPEVKISAAERAKKLEQRLKAVQARRDSNATSMGANVTSKIDTNAATAKPNPDSTSVTVAATPRPPATPMATTPTPVTRPPQTLAAPIAAKTNDASAPLPSKPTTAAPDTKPDQLQTVDKTTSPEPKKVNGIDTVPAACDSIEVPAAKEEVPISKTNATAKADLEAALQALNTKVPETDPAVSTPPKAGNGGHQTGVVPQELLDTSTQAPLGNLTNGNSLGCTEKECPNCTALVPMAADRCGCGFAFPPDDDAMPSLSLSDSDVEALEKRKKSSRISHLG